MNIVPKLVIVGALGFISLAQAATENDENNFVGDKISFAVDVKGIEKEGSRKDTCIPASMGLFVISGAEPREAINAVAAAASSPATAANSKVPDSPGAAASGAAGAGKPSDQTKYITVHLASESDAYVECNGTKVPLPSKKAILIDEKYLKNSGVNRYGLTYGGLVVPFKYYLKGNRDFTPGGTIGSYLGYRFDQNGYGFGVKVVGFAGLSGVIVKQQVDGKETSQTLAGYSYGIGFLGTVKKSFQFGLVLGKDQVGSSAKFENNGKTWISLSIGVPFDEK